MLVRALSVCRVPSYNWAARAIDGHGPVLQVHRIYGMPQYATSSDLWVRARHTGDANPLVRLSRGDVPAVILRQALPQVTSLSMIMHKHGARTPSITCEASHVGLRFLCDHQSAVTTYKYNEGRSGYPRPSVRPNARDFSSASRSVVCCRRHLCPSSHWWETNEGPSAGSGVPPAIFDAAVG